MLTIFFFRKEKKKKKKRKKRIAAQTWPFKDGGTDDGSHASSRDVGSALPVHHGANCGGQKGCLPVTFRLTRRSGASGKPNAHAPRETPRRPPRLFCLNTEVGTRRRTRSRRNACISVGKGVSGALFQTIMLKRLQNAVVFGRPNLVNPSSAVHMTST